MKKLLLGSSLLLVAAASAQAVEAPKWDELTISFKTADTKQVGDLKGASLAGTKLLGDNVLVLANISKTNDNNVDFNVMSFGIGARQSVTEAIDFYGYVSYDEIQGVAGLFGYTDSLTSGQTANLYGDKSALAINLGFKGYLSDELVVGLEAGRLNFTSKNEMRYTITTRYQINENFSAGVDWQRYNKAGVNIAGVSATYSF